MNQKKETKEIENVVKKINVVVRQMMLYELKQKRAQKEVNMKEYLEQIKSLMSKIKDVSK